MPDKIKTVTIATSKPGQLIWQGRQDELPRDTLKLGLQLPHRVPEQFAAHCASDPFGIFKLMLTSSSGGWQ